MSGWKTVRKIHNEMAPENSLAVSTSQDWFPRWHRWLIEMFCDGNQSRLFHLLSEPPEIQQSGNDLGRSNRSVPTCSCLVRNQSWGSCRNTCAGEWEGCAAPRRHLQDWAGRLEINALPSALPCGVRHAHRWVCVRVGRSQTLQRSWSCHHQQAAASCFWKRPTSWTRTPKGKWQRKGLALATEEWVTDTHAHRCFSLFPSLQSTTQISTDFIQRPFAPALVFIPIRKPDAFSSHKVAPCCQYRDGAEMLQRQEPRFSCPTNWRGTMEVGVGSRWLLCVMIFVRLPLSTAKQKWSSELVTGAALTSTFRTRISCFIGKF